VGEHPRPEPLDYEARLVDVVAVGVGDEKVGDREPLDVGRIEQRRNRAARVDDDARAARLVSRRDRSSRATPGACCAR